MAGTAQELERLTVRLVGDGSAYKRMLSQAEAATKHTVGVINRQLLGSVAATGQMVGQKLQRLGSSIMGMGTALTLGVTVPVAGAALACVKLASDMEGVRIQFQTMLGKDQGDAMLAKFKKYSDTTPFQFENVAGAGKSLLAFGVEADQLMPTMKMLGDVSSGTGKDIKELSVIFGQIRGMGRLQGQDFLQLVNAGFPVSEIAKTMGMDMKDLKGAMEDGLVPFEAVQETFRRLTAEGGKFHGMTEKLGQSTAGKFSTLLDNLKNLGVTIGNILLPYVNILMEYVSGLVDAFKEWAPVIGDLILPYVFHLAEVVGVLVDMFMALSPEVKMAIADAVLFTAVLAPVLPLIGGLIALVGTLVSGLFSMTAVWLGVIAVMLAVTDVLGVTSIGFGELFNSIRIGGTGLATWLGAAFIWLHQRFNDMCAGFNYLWARTVVGLKSIFNDLFVDPILAGIQYMAEKLAKLNSLLPKSMQIDALTQMEEDARGIGIEREKKNMELRQEKMRAENILGNNTLANDKLEKDMQQLFKNDPQDNTTGFSFDKDRAMKGLGQIGDSVMGAATDAFDYLRGMLPQMAGPAGPAGVKEVEKTEGEVAKWDGKLAEKKKKKKESEKETDFKQVALNRMSLAGMTGFGKPKKQEVEAKGVEHRLDKLIAVTQSKDSGQQPVLSE